MGEYDEGNYIFELIEERTPRFKCQTEVFEADVNLVGQESPLQKIGRPMLSITKDIFSGMIIQTMVGMKT
ncbi:MAG: hypothetical protein ABRQ26_11085 [Syntrophomonadaceae bacterium]